MEQDDIAIVGAGCRFPGADNLEEFWRVLLNGENHVKEIPLDRWNNEAFYDADKNVKGKSYVTRAGLLYNHDRWDNRLFGISDNEATLVDPQQRYVLECVHMAMEDAGITRAQLNGTNTGVMIGCMNDDYKVMLNLDSPEYTSYSATGMSTSVISARVSYVFNLHGTCLTLDTACSSALVAIHLAGQSLKTGDCDAMICGGVSSIVNPENFIPLCQARMMSTVGQCQTFCDTADGYARGEGCGIVILKRLKDALRDGNKIWGLIQTGSNQDGCMTKPITAPSGIQQTKLLKQLYQTYNVDPASIEYIEAHGTGTPRGDPTEINALGEFFVSHRKQHKMTKPLLIGSVKSNIGHTESAAGIAGLLKLLLMMKHGKIVPSLHVKPDKSNVNKKIRLQELDLDIAIKVEDWNDTEGPKIACLNSFGFGGSNAHAVVKKMPSFLQTQKISNEEETLMPVCLSAIDRDSLEQNLLTFQTDLETHDISLRAISHTSFCHRDIFSYRTVLFGKNRSDITNAIQGKMKTIKDITPQKYHNIVFVFCGVGTTWTGMCQELMAQNETFRETIRNIDEFLFPLAGWKIGDKLSSSTNYDEPFLNHIAIFSVQVALSRMWKVFGVQPDVIVGQSVGEVAAACVANLLSLEEAVNIIYHRSKILAQQSVGTMMVVGNMDIADIEEHCRQLDNKVTVAVYSSPKACTLSGHEVDLKELKQQIEDDADKNNKSVLIKELGVRCAYHSKLVEPCTEEIESTINRCLEKSNQSDIDKLKQNGQVPCISTVTGHLSTFDDVRTGTYWANNVRMPVKFMQGISESLTDDGVNLILEIGPRPVLRAHLPAIMGDQTNALVLPSLLANRELSRVHSTMTELFEVGIDLDWRALLPTNDGTIQIAEIPRYVFQRSTDLFYPEKVKLNLAGVRGESNDSHMFIKKVPGPVTENFDIFINPTKTPFVYEHFLSGSVLVPGATYVEVGFKIGLDMLRKPINQFSVKVEFASTFTPATGKDYKLMVETTETDKGRISYNVKSENRTLATGKIIDGINPARQPLNIEMLKSRLYRRVSKEEVYKSLADINFKYGPSLSLIQNAWASDTECLAEIHFSEDHVEELVSTHFHPAIVDAVFQMFGILNRRVQFTVPKGVDSIKLTGPLEHHMYCYAKEIKNTDTSSSYNALLVSKSGTVIAEFQNFYTKAISGADDKNTELMPKKLDWIEVADGSNNWIEHANDDLQKSHIVVFTSCIDSVVLKELQTFAIVELVKDVDEHVLTKQLDGECSGVVYHVGQSPSGHRTGKEVFDGTVKRFMDVKLILSVLSGRKSAVPFTVLTEKTQPIKGRTEINMEGSELWGMKRAVFHEGIHSNSKLIDIDSDNVNVKILAHLLRNTASDNKEFQLIGSKLYEAKLQKNKDAIPLSWKTHIGQREKMHMSSSKPGVVDQPFFWKEESHNSSKMKQPEMTYISLNVHVLHDSSIYLPTLDMPVTDDTVWHDAGHTAGYQMLTLEGQGTMLNKEKEKETDVIFCYPVSTATTVSVPQECIIRQEECMSYKNGLLIELNVLLNMMMVLPAGSEVILVSENDKPGLCRRFCEEIAKERQLTITICRLKDISRRRKVTRTVSIILSTKAKPADLEEIFKTHISVREMVAFQSMFDHGIQTWVQHKYRKTHFTVIKQGDVFSEKALRNNMPKLRGYLRAVGHLDLGSIIYGLPLEQLNLKHMLQQKTTNYVCDRSTLFSTRGCYVLIGGLTGLGWELLKLLAESGAGYIIPMSRRQPTADQSEKIASIMEAQSCHIHPLQVDIADYTSVQKTFAEISSLFPGVPVRGILHGAGVLSDTLLVNQDKEKVSKVLTPKVLGSWNLHQASLNLPLDFFVMHSSIVSVIGNHGQCNYAAGNSFLDALAAYRHSIGLPAKSLNWGALAVGMAADNPETEKALRSRGFRSLQTDQIRKFFIDALMSNETNIVLADIDWDMLGSSPAFMSQKSKYDSLITSVKQTRQDSSTDLAMDITKLMALEPSERQKEIFTILKSIVNDVFVVDKDSITLTTSLVAIGVDSMQAMSFSNKLIDIFGCQIPLISLLSEQTTLANIVETIMDKIKTTKSAAAAVNKDEKRQDRDKTEAPDNTSGQDNELDKLFGNKDVTFLQLGFLEKNRTQKTDPSQVRISDAEIENLKLDLKDWKLLLKHVLRMNPELRKLYSFTDDGGIEVKTVPADDVQPDIKIVDVHGMTTKFPYDIREDVTFDLEKELPIRIRIAENETGTLFRIILHCIVADMTSTAIICRDIVNTMTCHIEKKEYPVSRPVLSISEAIKKVVKPKADELQSFWSSYLDIPLTPVSLGYPISAPKGEHYVHNSNCLVPRHIVQEIQRYVGQRGISLYSFIMSVYQLYIHMETGIRYVPVGTSVNIRFHVPELGQAVTRGTNYIPVVANIDTEVTVDRFIETNSKNIFMTTQHGACPGQLISKNLSNQMKENIYRHNIVMNDVSTLQGMEQASNMREYEPKFNIETFFRVKYDLRKHWVEFETGFNSEVIAFQKGESFPQDIVDLMEICLKDGHQTIEVVREQREAIDDCPSYQEAVNQAEISQQGEEVQIPPYREIEVLGLHTNGHANGHANGNGHVPCKGRAVLLEGEFLKQTSQGWDHRVATRLVENEKEGRLVLEWCKSKSKKHWNGNVRSLDIHGVLEINLLKLNGLSAILLKAPKRWFVLKTSKHDQAQQWMTEITTALQK